MQKKKIKTPKTRVDYEIRYRAARIEFFHSEEDPSSASRGMRQGREGDMDGARFLKFVYQGVYDSQEQHRPGTSFPTVEREKERERKTPWQTELTPPRRANFVCHVGRQPRRKFDQPDVLKRNVFKNDTCD